MFTERKNYNLKTLNYLFLKMGIKTNLFAISNIYERHWSDKSLEGILNELSINYNLTTELKTTPCILCGNDYPKVALEVFAYRVAKYVGSYVAAMNGVDVIAFTAGIGENSGTVRSAVLKYLGYLGITVDEKANDTHGEEITISTPDSKVLVMVIPTNEELAIARETVALV